MSCSLCSSVGEEGVRGVGWMRARTRSEWSRETVPSLRPEMVDCTSSTLDRNEANSSWSNAVVMATDTGRGERRSSGHSVKSGREGRRSARCVEVRGGCAVLRSMRSASRMTRMVG